MSLHVLEIWIIATCVESCLLVLEIPLSMMEEVGCLDVVIVGVEAAATRVRDVATGVGGLEMLRLLIEELELLVLVLRLEK